MNDYKILNIIGQGAFGNAYLARHTKENQEYVVKKIELNGKNKEQIENIYHEVKLLEEFKHVNIVSYRESFKEGQDLNIIMEFCSGGDLNQLIVQEKESHGGRKLEEKRIIDWTTQVALAIFYMHDKRILHRDLKTPNIFIIGDRVKLGDFGISKVLDEKQDLASTSIGTPYYMSPEQYRHKPYSYKSDIWAFGCILYEMCNQKRPFEALSLNGLAVKVLEAKFSPVSECYSKQLRDLIHRTLQKKEKDRPSILEFLQTPIIKRRVTSYLRQTYTTLLKENGDKVLIEGVIYQAKKLGISLPTAEKKSTEVQKKVKPEFTAQKKRQQKERIRQQLEEQLKKMSDKTKQQKQQLKQQINERKKGGQKVLSYRKQSQSSASSKSFKDPPSTVASEERISAPVSVKVEEKPQPKQFEIKEKYDMYEMEFEEEGDSEEQNDVIDEEDEEEEKQIKPQTQPQAYSKEKYVKPAQRDVKEVKQVKETKESKPQPSKFTQVKPQNPSMVESQVPIEQKINNLKEQLKNNMQRVNTIKNQISAIDFSFSSSDDDELSKNIEPQRMPVVKKRSLNPVHVLLTDKANDIQQSLENIMPKTTIKELTHLARSKGSGTIRPEIEKVVGKSKQGAYHLAFQLVKLRTMLDKIPLYS